ncbi:MAG TPA: glycine zipper family protein [Dongiaceae bacterium]|nr:glycine zipper family protein [Dongiaceae bacterium]
MPCAILLPILILAGCATDDAPAGNTPAPDAAYQADLDSCQSYAAAARASHGAEGFLVGALWGAANGAAAGAGHGNADIGAAIGASVGAVIGFVQGLSWPDEWSISSCMHAKGYQRV